MPFSIAHLFSFFLALPRTVASRRPAYDSDEFARVAAGRDCFVIVHGNPFHNRGYDGEAFVEAAVDAMQGRNWGPATRFTARTPSGAHPDYRVTLLFNGTATVRAADLCSGTVRATDTIESADGRIRVLAAWCKEGAVLSEVSGWIDGVKTPADRGFTRLIAQVTRDLFPTQTEPGSLKGH
jgi:hypothetical protein